ncbi:hypothetical protein ACWAT4_20625 [Bradyrhizobium manausense]
MNHSVYTADKATHLKVVISVLLINITVMAIMLTARLTQPEVSAGAAATLSVDKPHPTQALTELARLKKHPI